MVAAPPSAPSAAAAWSQALLSALPPIAGPLAPVQERGRRGLAERPMPGRRDEPWRFTDLAALLALDPRSLAAPPAPAAAGVAAPGPAPSAGVLRLQLDGAGDPLAGLTLPEGLTRLEGPDLEQALGQSLEVCGCREHWPVLLNKAATGRVLALRVRGAVHPTLELVSDAGAAPGLLPLRVCLLLEEQASLSVLQVHRSAGANLTSVVVEAHLGRGARLAHGLLGAGAAGSVLFAHLAVLQEPGSHLSQATATAGWELARIEPHVHQAGGGAHSRLRGLQRVEGHQMADTHSHVHFAGPDGGLDQLHKVVADGAGRSVFNGAVRVPREAQHTDAAQLSRSLLLSDRARIDTKPELEIVADDVRCAHGATVSRLQQDELFYLQSRGIAADQAARLLLRGYCEEVLRDLPAAAASWQPLSILLGDPTDR